MFERVFREPKLLGLSPTVYAQIPPLDTQDKVPTNVPALAEFLFHKPPLTVFFGGKGKTTVALQVVRAIAEYAHNREEIIDEGRITFAKPSDFADYHNHRLRPDTGRMDVILQSARLLVIDNFDLIETRYVEEAVALIVERMDADKPTILVVPNMVAFEKFGDRFVAKLHSAQLVKF